MSSYLQLYPTALSFPLLALQWQLMLSPKLGKHQWLKYTQGSKMCYFRCFGPWGRKMGEYFVLFRVFFALPTMWVVPSPQIAVSFEVEQQRCRSQSVKPQAALCLSRSRLMPWCSVFKALLMSDTCLQLWSHLVTPHKSRCSDGIENRLWSRLWWSLNLFPCLICMIGATIWQLKWELV